MVSPIPQPASIMYGAVSTPEEAPSADVKHACVDCAANGDADPLKIVYTVQGTVLCLDHAVAERAAQKAGSTK